MLTSTAAPYKLVRTSSPGIKQKRAFAQLICWWKHKEQSKALLTTISNSFYIWIDSFQSLLVDKKDARGPKGCSEEQVKPTAEWDAGENRGVEAVPSLAVFCEDVLKAAT